MLFNTNKNLPLNDIGKNDFSQLLQNMGFIAMQANDYKTSIKYYLKSIDTLEDLYMLDLYKSRGRVQLQIRNKLGKLYIYI